MLEMKNIYRCGVWKEEERRWLGWKKEAKTDQFAPFCTVAANNDIVDIREMLKPFI